MRSDIVPLRMVGCEALEAAVSLAEPKQHFPGGNTNQY